jgi:hypothetical protein
MEFYRWEAEERRQAESGKGDGKARNTRGA